MSFKTISEQKCFGGTQGVYQHASTSVKCDMTFSVFVPSRARTQKCAHLYYLSGLTCTHENVTTKAGFQQYAEQHNLIIICPDTSPRNSDHPQEHESYDFGSGASFYVNATQTPWSKNYRMYDYVVSELPQLVQQHFPVDPQRCGIFGHSMGGHGALVIGLRNPVKYQSISAFSPIVAPSQSPWGQKALTGYLGSDQSTWKSVDATELIKQGYRCRKSILIDQGANDKFLDDQLKTPLFAAACEQQKQQTEIRMQKGYDHSYFFIQSFMSDHLRFHANNLEKS